MGSDLLVDEVEALGRQRRAVERIRRTPERSACSRGTWPDFATASMNFAEVPNTSARSFSAQANSTPGSGWVGEPS